MKKLIYILSVVGLVVWVGFRFWAIQSENSRYEFNTARVSEQAGAPVNIITVNRKTDVLKEPLFVKNNRALVSSSRVSKFRNGQKVGNGTIVSVSNNIDLDSGMHVIMTRGVSDGLNYAESKSTGFFIPVYAVDENSVMIVKDGIAQKNDVRILDQDSENAVVASGLSNGDIVILSKVGQGEKVKIEDK